MPQDVFRSSAVRRNRRFAALCLSLALCGSASAADPARIRPEPGPASAIQLRVSPAALPADPEAGLGLLQRIARLFERIFDDRPVADPSVDPPSGWPAKTATLAEIVSYAGPLQAGTVVINLDRFQVYRILGGGLAERYQEQSKAAVLARVGLVR